MPSDSLVSAIWHAAYMPRSPWRPPSYVECRGRDPLDALANAPFAKDVADDSAWWSMRVGDPLGVWCLKVECLDGERRLSIGPHADRACAKQGWKCASCAAPLRPDAALACSNVGIPKALDGAESDILCVCVGCAIQ